MAEKNTKNGKYTTAAGKLLLGRTIFYSSKDVDALAALLKAWDDDVILAKMSEAELKAVEAVWDEQTAHLRQQKAQAAADAAEDKNRECSLKIEQSRLEHQRNGKALEKELAQAKNRETELERNIASLKPMQFLLKDRLKNNLALIRYNREVTQNKLENMGRQQEQREAEIRKTYAQISRQAVAQAEAQFSVPENPGERALRIRRYLSGYLSSAWQERFTEREREAMILEYVPVMLSACDKMHISKIALAMEIFFCDVVGENIQDLKKRMDMAVSSALAKRDTGIISCYQIGNDVYYSLTQNKIK